LFRSAGQNADVGSDRDECAAEFQVALDQSIIAGEDPDHVRESQLRLARVGIENASGYLEDGMAGWIKGGFEADYIPQIGVEDLANLMASEGDHVAILDVREPSETLGGAIEGSIRIPLAQLAARIGELDRNKLLVVHCKGGYRSSIATSLLRRAGFRDIANLTGGFDAWKAAAEHLGAVPTN